jgi:CheY-like chemotaxis protein
MVEEPENLNCNRKKILLADPDPVSCCLVSEVLSKHGIETVSAGCGLEAIRLLRENHSIRCLITEIRVPGLDGFGILRAAREINPSLTVIAQTAYVHDNMKQKCLTAGFNEYISKPIDLGLFVNMVRKYVSVSASSR